MPFVYVPEKWRKKFTPGQTVWYVNHVSNEVVAGEFRQYEPHDHDSEDTVWINGALGSCNRILEAWVFTDREKAKQLRKRILIVTIAEREHELKRLKEKLEKM
jgi:hypothetical protein